MAKSKPLTKSELVADIAERSNVQKAQAAAALDAVITSISAQPVAGNAVVLSGLAKFEIRDRPARKMRNPSTGATFDKEADKAVKISALSAIKAAVNEG